MKNCIPFFQNFYLLEILITIFWPLIHSSFVDELFSSSNSSSRFSSPSNHTANNQSYIVGSTVHLDSNAMDLTEQHSFSARIYVPPRGARTLSTSTRPMSDQDYEKWLEGGERESIAFKDFDDDDSHDSDLTKVPKNDNEESSVERDGSRIPALNSAELASSEESDFSRPTPTRIGISDFSNSKSGEISNEILYEAANRSVVEGVRNANGLFVFVTRQPLVRAAVDGESSSRSGSDEERHLLGHHKADGVRNTNGLFPLPPNMRIRIHSEENSAEAPLNDELKHEKQKSEGKFVKVTDELQAFSIAAAPTAKDPGGESGQAEGRAKAEGVRNQNGLYTLPKEAATKAAVLHADEAGTHSDPPSAEVGRQNSNGLFAFPTSHNRAKSERDDDASLLPPKNSYLDGVAVNSEFPEKTTDDRTVHGLYKPSNGGGGRVDEPRTHRAHPSETDVGDEIPPQLPPVPRLEDVQNRRRLREHPGHQGFESQSNERFSTHKYRHRPHGRVESALTTNGELSLGDNGGRNSHGLHAYPKRRVLGRVASADGGGESGLHAVPNILASKSRSAKSASRSGDDERGEHGFFSGKPVKVVLGKRAQKAARNRKLSSAESGVAQKTNPPPLAHGSEALEPFSPGIRLKKLPALLEAVKTVTPFANGNSVEEANSKVVSQHGTTIKIEKTNETKIGNETTALETANKPNVTDHSSNETVDSSSKASNSMEDTSIESENSTEKHGDGSYDDDSAGDCEEWSRWSKCSKPCGGCGMRRRKRVCKDSKEPQIEKLSCQLRTCPFPRQTCCKGREPKFVDKMLICLKKEKPQSISE